MSTRTTNLNHSGARGALASRAFLGALALVLVGGCDNGSDTFDSDTDTDVGAGLIVVDPCDFNFGRVGPGALVSAGFSAANRGSAPSEIVDIVSDTAEFEVQVTSLPITVDPSAQYTFSVRFDPGTGYGDFAGYVTITWDDVETTCRLTGSVEADQDADGFRAEAAGGDDCDDEDPDVYPGAAEVYYDGVDSNCDGWSDFDQDQDGYDSKVFNPNASTGGGDCVDVDPTINPGAVDIWYDGIDSNCDGKNDFDKDGDGYKSIAAGGTDCDDEDPDVNINGTESFNRKDDDCDGRIDNGASADEADLILVGSSTTDAAGRGLAAGDFDGSGAAIDDLAIGVWHYDYTSSGSTLTGDAYGGLAIFLDGSMTDYGDIYADADIFVTGDTENDELGFRVVSLGDYDEDGYGDIAVTALAAESRAGRIYVFSGIDMVTGMDINDAVTTITGKDDYRLGYGLYDQLDFNGDGAGDVFALGVNSYDTQLNAALLYGGALGDYEWADVDASWRWQCGTVSGSYHTCGPPPTGAGSEFGGTRTFSNSAHGTADFDGDGYNDIIAGDRWDDTAYAQAGRAWVLWGRAAQYSVQNGSFNSSGTVIASGERVKDLVGYAVGPLPDLDLDGDNELAVLEQRNGNLYIIDGGSDLRSGTLDLSSDPMAVFEFGTSANEITSITNPGDWTGDGDDDFMIAFGSDDHVYFYDGATAYSGTYDGDNAIVGELEGGGDNNEFGSAVFMGHADMDGDGNDNDMIIGDYDYDDGTVSGSVHLFYNPF